MKNLQERVQTMVNGENKRRSVALNWISEVEEILLPVSEHMWGNGDSFGDIPSYTITLTKLDKDNKKRDTCIYFRYKLHEGMNKNECVGFYDNSSTDGNMWGDSVTDLKGKDFWYAIQIIVEWIPQLINNMDKREESRNVLLEKIN